MSHISEILNSTRDWSYFLFEYLCHVWNCFIFQNMSGNDIGAIGAPAVGEMMRLNRGMKKLNLAKNNFNDEAGRYLGAGLEVKSF